MSDFAVTRSHSSWDVVLGVVLAVIGLVILGNAAIATRVSIQFLGWMLLIAGIAGLASALMNIHTGGFWSSAIGGGLLLVVGLMCLRHVEAAALTLTLIAGALFLMVGVVRLFAAAGSKDYRWALIFGGTVSTILGLVVLLNLFHASYVLLGVLLGIQTLVEGVSMILFGRVTVAAVRTDELTSNP